MKRGSERSFFNRLPDYTPGSPSLLDKDGKLMPKLAEPIRSTALGLQKMVSNAYMTGQGTDKKDITAYTGLTGAAYLELKYGDVNRARQLIEPALMNLKGRHKDCSFLCGDCGPLAVAALIYNKLGPICEPHRKGCISKILEIMRQVCESEDLPNELLYGRAGYLYTLILLHDELGETVIKKKAIINVALTIIAHGQRSRELPNCPLTYSWHHKHYFGAAHGYSGILYMLLQVAMRCPELRLDHVLVPAIDYMLSLKFPSGNYPSSFEAHERDLLVHWCHGAPGFIHMFAAAYEKFNEERYKVAVMECAEVIWRRGLLRKGYGICHGVAGNAYAFLAAYRVTKDPLYMHRAHQFATYCCQYGAHGCRTPDAPYSLFEGMAGTSYFLHEMVKPLEAKFPAFEV